jgi:aminoglycoside 3-N-acetyltransferase
LAEQFRALGLSAGQSVLLHSSMSELGFVVGGAPTVVLALLDVLTERGTLMVPTHSAGNSEPSRWQNPPVPHEWWPTIRDEMPAFDPQVEPLWLMGAVAETVWRWPNAGRSNHPQHSFAAVGQERDTLVGGFTPYDAAFGEDSPLGRLYALDGYILLLGVGHENNTALHMAESRTDYPGKHTEAQGAAVQVDGVRQWITFDAVAWESDDFYLLGAAFEAKHPEAVRLGKVGKASARLIRQRPLVDFGVGWLPANRPQSLLQQQA